ncbi:MAG: hypothetical protein P8L74_05340 [Gammaproteobacteria bacterium]|nr:hypothetical protein [Gammaproteobacteria bacterium]
MPLSKEELIHLELCFHEVNAYKGSKTVDPDYSGSLFDGIENALITVANAYRIGEGVKKDKNEAITHLLMAMELGSGEAAMQLSNIFTHDDWWEKESYDFSPEECVKTAKNLWQIEVNNGSSYAAWRLYQYSKEGTEEARKWFSVAIELAKKSGEDVSEMEKIYKHNETRDLRNFDFLGMPLVSLENYFRKDPPGGEWNYLNTTDPDDIEWLKSIHEKKKTEMRQIQQNILNRIKEIKRPLNPEEKKEIERLKELCSRDA